MASNENTADENESVNPGAPSAEGAKPAEAGSSGDEGVAKIADDAIPSARPPAPQPDPLAALTAERDKLKDQLLRTLADFDNYRKRSRRDEQESARRGREDLLRELLPVFDNLERASLYAKTGGDAKAIADGVGMVLRLFEDTLTRVGGKRLKSVGQPFDPNVHEAIQQVDSAEHAAGLVAQELVAGYQLGERLLRPAMVAVSKGPGSAPATPPAADDSNAN